MALMNKKSFVILQTLDDGHLEEDYIEVDDMIALPVAILNQNGFTTTASCAGHPFPNEYLIRTRNDLKKPIEHICEMSQDSSGAEDAEYLIFRLRTYAKRVSYIEFKDPLPENIQPPEGWFYDPEENWLYCRYPKREDPYTFFLAQIKRMQALTKWAKSIR